MNFYPNPDGPAIHSTNIRNAIGLVKRHVQLPITIATLLKNVDECITTPNDTELIIDHAWITPNFVQIKKKHSKLVRVYRYTK